jgi:predicted nucleic acid-binding protein
MVYFFDTSALQHRYIDGPKARGIRRSITESRNTCYISDFTVLEIASALGTHCRKNRLPVTAFQRLDQAFWKDIAAGKLRVRNATQRDFLRARQLLRYAGVEKKRNIKSADALIAASCLEFALETRQDVTFCLEDWTLYDVVRNITAYRKVLNFRYIGVDKSLVRGGGH